jgi:hypothetical protein
MPTADDAEQPFYCFPTLDQLASATEAALRADGFGYRAKFIVGSVQQLLEKPGGGAAWLLGLREKPYVEAQEALCSLPGVGPKVAACICLFSLDKPEAIPVDTHVWDLAVRHYAPHLAKKTLNKKLHDQLQEVFVQRFGPCAGWAHNTLFIAELASHRQLLPAGLIGGGGHKRSRSRRTTAAAAAAAGSSSATDDSDGDERESEGAAPAQAAKILATSPTAGAVKSMAAAGSAGTAVGVADGCSATKRRRGGLKVAGQGAAAAVDDDDDVVAAVAAAAAAGNGMASSRRRSRRVSKASVRYGDVFCKDASAPAAVDAGVDAAAGGGGHVGLQAVFDAAAGCPVAVAGSAAGNL